jgi:hypothetical protein
MGSIMLVHIFVKNIFNGMFFAFLILVLLPVGIGTQAGMQY